MAKIYLEHAKTKRRYDVVSFDKEKGTVRLKGEHAEFTEKFDKARFKEMGYELRTEE